MKTLKMLSLVLSCMILSCCAPGFESEQVLPETVEAVAALLSKGAGAIEDINSLHGLPGQKTEANSVTLFEILMKDGKTSLVEIGPND